MRRLKTLEFTPLRTFATSRAKLRTYPKASASAISPLSRGYTKLLENPPRLKNSVRGLVKPGSLTVGARLGTLLTGIDLE